jgi:hypothetical protein
VVNKEPPTAMYKRTKVSAVELYLTFRFDALLVEQYNRAYGLHNAYLRGFSSDRDLFGLLPSCASFRFNTAHG